MKRFFHSSLLSARYLLLISSIFLYSACSDSQQESDKAERSDRDETQTSKAVARTADMISEADVVLANSDNDKSEMDTSRASEVSVLPEAPYGEAAYISLIPLDLSRPPSEKEIRMAGQLDGPLFPSKSADVTAITNPGERVLMEADNLSFAEALQEWNSQNDVNEAVELLLGHIRKYPNSPWRGEARIRIGLNAQAFMRWSEAESQFDDVLNRNAPGSDIYQKALLYKGALYAKKADFDKASEIFAQLLETEKNWERAQEAQTWLQRLSLMREDQKVYAHCGADSLSRMLAINENHNGAEVVQQAIAKSEAGFSLDELDHLAKSEGLNSFVLKVEHDQWTMLNVPFIVHLKENHYILVESKNEDGSIKVYDPFTQKEDASSIEQLSKNASGLVLALAMKSDADIRLATAEERETFGACNDVPVPGEDLGKKPSCEGEDGNCGGGVETTNDRPESSPSCNPDPNSQAPGCGGQGMPVWMVNEKSLNVTVRDTPLWYKNNIGPDVNITLTYNSQDSLNQLRPFGSKWMLNYASYLKRAANGIVTLVSGDGSCEVFLVNNGTESKRGWILEKTANYAYTITNTNGMVYYYGVPEKMLAEYPGSSAMLLLAIEDKHGNRLSIVHDKNGRIDRVQDALGRQTKFFYASNGMVKRVDDPFGRSAYFYYQDGRLIRQIDMGGLVYGYDYDQAAVGLKSTDTAGGTYSPYNASYSSTNYIRKINLPLGTYDFYIEPPDGRNAGTGIPASGGAMGSSYRVTVTDPLGEKEEYFYFAPQRSGSLVIPGREKISYMYSSSENRGVVSNYVSNVTQGTTVIRLDRNGNIITDASGNPIEIVYNSKNKVVGSTDQSGRYTQINYISSGKGQDVDVKAIYDADNRRVAFYERDSRRRITENTNANNIRETYAYDDRGLLISHTRDAGGANQDISTYEYDEMGQLVNQNVNGICIASYIYDAIGRLKSESDHLEGTYRQYEYDGLNRLTKITFPDGTSIRNTWECCGISSIVARDGSMTQYAYDAKKRLVSVKNGNNGILQYKYNPDDTLAELIDPMGNTTHWEYDGSGNVKKKVYADGTFVSFVYDANDRISQYINARAQTIDYSYDLVGNLKTVSGDNLAGYSFPSYDSGNRVLQAQDTYGTSNFVYDNLGRRINMYINGHNFNYTYDRLGRVKTYWGGTRNYDSLSRITNESNGLGSFNYSYDDATAYSAVTNISGGDYGLDISFDYHKTGVQSKVASINAKWNGNMFYDMSYTYDAMDRIKEWKSEGLHNLFPSGTNYKFTKNYAYDKAGQLLWEKGLVDNGTGTYQSQNHAYHYDKNGNMVNHQENSNLGENGVFNHVNQLKETKVADSVYFYGTTDKPSRVAINGQNAKISGNNAFEAWVPLSAGSRQVRIEATDEGGRKTTQNYTVNVGTNGSMRTLTYDADGNLKSDGQRTYEWDALNRLMAINYVGSNKRTEFGYNAFGERVRIIEKTGGSITKERRFIWDGGVQPVREVSNTNAVVWQLFAQGVLTNGSIKTYFVRDHLGSIRYAFTPMSGTVYNTRYDYTPYGERKTISVTNPYDYGSDFGFTGHFLHKESGLYLTLHRAYDPVFGRWLSREPLGELQKNNLNLYAYCFNDPINNLDFDGKDWWQTVKDIGNVVIETVKTTIEALNPFPVGPSTVQATGGLVQYVDCERIKRQIACARGSNVERLTKEYMDCVKRNEAAKKVAEDAAKSEYQRTK